MEIKRERKRVTGWVAGMREPAGVGALGVIGGSRTRRDNAEG